MLSFSRNLDGLAIVVGRVPYGEIVISVLFYAFTVSDKNCVCRYAYGTSKYTPGNVFHNALDYEFSFGNKSEAKPTRVKHPK